MIRAFLLINFLFILSLSGSVLAQQRHSQTLFHYKKAPASADARYSAAAVKEAVIAMIPASLVSDSTTFEIPLFDGKTYTAVRRDLELRASDDYTWRGVIKDGQADLDVMLTFKSGYAVGLIYAPDAVYEISTRGDEQVITQIDQSRYPVCGGEPAPLPLSDNTDRSDAFLLGGVAQDSGDRIDVLMVYTPATRNMLGGHTQAATFAQAAIDSANTTYINSGIRMRVRMVHAEEYNFVETASSSADLTSLRSNAAIQALRNTHQADLVAMIGEMTDNCGIAYLLTTQAHVASGYSYTARSCSIGNLSFAHELGHNMGSAHNPENSGSSPWFPYSYGHYVNGVFRTVMSYVNPCPNGCTRRPYFSNPAVSFNGHPVGIDTARDNVRSINNTADILANFRYSGSSITLTNFSSGDMLPRGITRNIQWTSNNVGGSVRIEYSRDEGKTWEVLHASTPNDGSAPITLWGPATKRARIRITSLDVPFVSDSSVANIAIR
ncbi:MAG: hypothetical protein KF855_15730 [Acidobacteria bacterium]|nr:hypothetical protein [Acidobacteriota bacterium]